ncbi:MAG: hypothetical protein CMJ19_24795 [Phycisphaeraceae bacterium]|nr:hypothetical protein [Phycisphaeraceae bacterium]
MKTLWYILAFGISVTLHASLLFFGDPTHTAEVPQQQGHAAVMINLVASVDSQAQQAQRQQSQQKTQPVEENDPSDFIESMLYEDIALAAPVIDPTQAMLPPLHEPTVRDVQTSHKPTPLPKTTNSPVIEHEAVMIDLPENQLVEPADQATQQVTPAPQSVESNSTTMPQGVTTQARLADPLAPVYPMLYRRRGIEGTTTVKVEVTATGLARSVVVTCSSGYDRFDAAAIKACREVRYLPALKQGHPAHSFFEFDVVFRLQSRP